MNGLFYPPCLKHMLSLNIFVDSSHPERNGALTSKSKQALITLVSAINPLSLWTDP